MRHRLLAAGALRPWLRLWLGVGLFGFVGLGQGGSFALLLLALLHWLFLVCAERGLEFVLPEELLHLGERIGPSLLALDVLLPHGHQILGGESAGNEVSPELEVVAVVEFLQHDLDLLQVFAEAVAVPAHGVELLEEVGLEFAHEAVASQEEVLAA